VEEASQIYRFGPFALDAGRRELLQGGAVVPLGMRAFDVLLALIERRGRLVTKDELMKAIWPGAIVEENTLAAQIASVRRTLGDGKSGARYVLTVQARGYRFVGLVSEDPIRTDSTEMGELQPQPSAVDARPTNRGSNLPFQVTPLVGRDAELDTIKGALSRSRSVTLTGAAGVGKTRVTCQVGFDLVDSYPDGVWLCEFAALSSAQLLSETVAGVLAVSVPAGLDAIELIATYLKEKKALLIFDNCEHLVEAAGGVATALLSRCGSISILASSREPLGVSGENVLTLKPLEYPGIVEHVSRSVVLQHAAAQLFEQRAQAVEPAFRVDDGNAAAVGTICRRLDGIPFAIELAARWVRIMSPAELAERLDDRFDLLTRGGRAPVPQQQTLRTLIKWSYDLLTENQRIAFRRLSILSGTWTVGSAVAVVSYPPLARTEVFSLIAELVDKSLIASEQLNGSPRFRMLESTRAFGLEMSRECDEPPDYRRLCEYLRPLLIAADTKWPVTPTTEWFSEFSPELQSLRSALEWAFGIEGDNELGIELVAYGNMLWEEIGLVAERRRWLELAATRIGASTSSPVLGRLGLGLGFAGNYERAMQLDPRLEPISHFRRLEDKIRLGLALRQAAAHKLRPDDVEAAERDLLEAEKLLRPLGSTKPLCGVLDMRSAARRFAGDRAGCRQLLNDSIHMADGLDFSRSAEVSMSSLADLEYEDGDLEAAIELARRAADRSLANRNTRGLAFALANLTGYLVAKGDVRAGLEVGYEALRSSSLVGDHLSGVWVIEHLALALALSKELQLAARLAGFGQAYYVANGEIRYGLELANRSSLDNLLQAIDATTLQELMDEGAAWTAEVTANEIYLTRMKSASLFPHSLPKSTSIASID